jgi:hypothetical protein
MAERKWRLSDGSRESTDKHWKHRSERKSRRLGMGEACNQ